MAPWDLQRGMTSTGPFPAARSKVRSGMWTMLVTPVASKIRYLQEYHNRVLHNIYPVPSGTDIANTLKYFSQTLLSILSRTGKKENQDASNLTVPMTMCLFPVPFPLTPSLRPQVSSINPTVTRSLLYSVLRDAPSERGLQSRDAHLSDYPSLDYQGLYVTLVTLLDLVPLLQHGQHGEHLIETFENVYVCLWMLETVIVIVINCLKGLCVAIAFLTLKLNYGVSLPIIFCCFMARGVLSKPALGRMSLREEEDYKRNSPILL
ncbi:protein unc-79 homolog [Camelus ferus]|uniref:Protein unc-79 homolog n=1 Tax=Camelus ferus TaxID=419612 RepID=A0A8B8T3A6_CAMFR|nr:protein unc-79 homolog [Camelus ferus]